jgi:hypothetical protein
MSLQCYTRCEQCAHAPEWRAEAEAAKGGRGRINEDVFFSRCLFEHHADSVDFAEATAFAAEELMTPGVPSLVGGLLRNTHCLDRRRIFSSSPRLYEHSSPHVCMSIAPQCKSYSEIFRVLVLNDPAAWWCMTRAGSPADPAGLGRKRTGWWGGAS